LPNLRRTDTPPSAVASGVIAAGQVKRCHAFFAGERLSLSGRERVRANALIPIIYYFFKHPNAHLLGSTAAVDVTNATAIRRWLLTALLNGVFGGQSDNVLRDTRRVLEQQSGKADFPIETLNADFREAK
jgi:hypothetical protein